MPQCLQTFDFPGDWQVDAAHPVEHLLAATQWWSFVVLDEYFELGLVGREYLGFMLTATDCNSCHLNLPLICVAKPVHYNWDR